MKETDKDLQDLEKLDLEFEEMKKSKPESVDEAFKFKKTPKPKPDEPEDVSIPIKIGKGHVPEKMEDVENTVQLKKRPKKESEDLPEDVAKEKRIVESVPKDTEPKSEAVIKGPQFEPFDIERESPEITKPGLPEQDAQEKLKPETDKEPYKPRKQKKPKPEIVEIPIIKGEPKPPEEEEEQDVKFRIPKRDIPEDEPDSISLKPFQKTEDYEDQKAEVEVIPKETAMVKEIPDDTDAEKTKDESIKKIPKKVTKKES